MSLYLGRSTPVFGVRHPFDSPLDSFRWGAFSLVLRLCSSYGFRKWCKVYTKSESWFQKLDQDLGQIQTNSWKSKKLKFDGLLSSKKCIPSTEILSCVKLHQIPYVIFETISHFSRDTTRRYFFSSKITYFRQKMLTPSSDCVKIDIKSLTPFFKQKFSFSSKFESLFSVMRYKSSLLF